MRIVRLCNHSSLKRIYTDIILKVRLAFANRFSKLDIVLYTTSLILLVFCKLFYKGASVEQLQFLLEPVSKLVSMFWNLEFLYDGGIGFYTLDKSIVLNKGCSGMNYCMITFMMLAFSFLHQFKKAMHKLSFWVLCFVMAYIATVFINTFRIISSIWMLHNAGEYTFLKSVTFHEMTGILYYSFFLMICYNIATRYFVKGSEMK